MDIQIVPKITLNSLSNASKRHPTVRKYTHLDRSIRASSTVDEVVRDLASTESIITSIKKKNKGHVTKQDSKLLRKEDQLAALKQDDLERGNRHVSFNVLKRKERDVRDEARTVLRSNQLSYKQNDRMYDDQQLLEPVVPSNRS
eukprot:GILI01001337.1.p2 GENE.GILI01001337.1~~GILI01001337.1.p2  ORF type:complete len:144 (+),score=48.44 GILI01001337.1:105-536(+)